MSGLFLRTDSSSSMFNGNGSSGGGGGGVGGSEVTPVKSSSPSDSSGHASNPSQSPLSSPGLWSVHAAQAGSPGPSQIGSPLASHFVSPVGSPAASGAYPQASSSSSSGAVAPAPPGPTSSSIVVAIRMRPLSERETSLGDSSIWRGARALSPDGVTPGPAVIEELQDAVGKQYRFDYLCPAEEGTTDLYKNLVRRFVLKSCVGYNSNVFAYGQTASGKTYTTLGDSFSPGIVLLAIGDIFHYIAQSPNRQFLLRISCLEIYNEEINDLLVSDGSGQNLKLENVGGLNKDGTLNPALTSGVKIKGLRQEFVRSPAEFIALLLRSEENRKIASTDANLRSSRSHTMFRIHIESRARAPTNPDGTPAATDPNAGVNGGGANAHARKIRSSLLTFVDLAGSECISQLGGSLERQKECRYINKSLLGLSRVIVKLSENDAGDQTHVPWRDSKLTRVMKPALGGNSHTLFVCCISPTNVCKEESHNTLRFGSFANQVTNVVRVNLKEEQVRSEAARSAAEVARLRSELERRQAEEAEMERLRRANAELTERMRVLHLAATQSASEALEAQKALNACQAALLDAQRMLEAEREDRERAARAAASATPVPDPRIALDALEQEKEYFKLKLNIAEGQIKLLEQKLVPMIEEARAAASEEQQKLAERDSTIASLREQIESLTQMREADRAAFEAERRRGEGDRERALRQLLADKNADQRDLESRLATEQSELHQARLAAMRGGTDTLKICRNKVKQHVVRMWLAPARDPRAGGDPLDLALHWSGSGLLGSRAKFVRLADVELVKLGQGTPAFERALAAPGPPAAELARPDSVARSLSVVTAHRTLDVLMPSERALELWAEGLKPLLPAARGAKVEELRPGKAADQAALRAKEMAQKEAAQRRAEEEQRLLAPLPAAPFPGAAAAAASRPLGASAASSSSSPPAGASSPALSNPSVAASARQPQQQSASPK